MLIECVADSVDGAVQPQQLKDVARLTGYSRYHLTRIVQEQIGQTIGEYISEKRLDYTKSALAHGLTQKEIAANLGFASPASFWLWRSKKHS